VFGGGVIVAGEHQAPLAANSRHLATRARRILELEICTALVDRVQLDRRHVTKQVLSPFGDVRPLPLPRRVVHQGNQPDERIIDEAFECLDHLVGGNFTAKVQKVFRFQQSLGLPALHRAKRLDQRLPAARASLALVPDTQGVEHSGHAAGRNLPIMRDKRGKARPGDARTGLQMSLQVVGIEYRRDRG
jgi:hypothetical protein